MMTFLRFLLVLTVLSPLRTPTSRAADAPPAPPPTGAPDPKPKPKPTLESAEGVDAPPAPVLSPEEALTTFKLPPGFRIELVAAEPLIGDPVVANFDADGRLWVVEMRGYMPDAEGRNELAPVGRVVVLDDADGDGRMDKSTVFLDGLVLPRAILPVLDGALVAEPPFLYFCRDTDGDGKADEKTEVAKDYGKREGGNPEHMANGLTYGLDNWVHSANYFAAYRHVGGRWPVRAEPVRGQWGMSQDDWGRLYHNGNSDYLRGDLLPAHYFNRNGHYADALAGVNVQIDADQQVFPSRVNWAVNRGYQDGVLRPDGTLRNFTGACTPHVYRGDAYPEEFAGNVFVCEPTANFVRRSVVREDGYRLKGDNAYEAEKTEFLTSSDEWFRPVHLTTGPDGALYVVDLHRGVLQHRIYLTPYLKQLLLRRGMDKPIGLGRIFRIVPDGAPARKPVKLSKLPAAELVKYLSDPNGLLREHAQRLLVERGDGSVIGAIREVARAAGDPRGRVHALWTLEGLGQIDTEILTRGLTDEHPHVRANAVRLSEVLLVNDQRFGNPDTREPGGEPGGSAAGPGGADRRGITRPHDEELLSTVLARAADKHPVVRLQFALTAGAIDRPQVLDALATLLSTDAADPLIREAAINGLKGRELAMIERLLADPQWENEDKGRADLLAPLAWCVLREGMPDRVRRVLDLAADQTEPTRWRQAALLSGFGDVARRAEKGPKMEPITLDAAPAAVEKLAASTDERVRTNLAAVTNVLHWPGKQDAAKPAVEPLTADQQALFDKGKVLFGATCAACHQPGGEGLEGKAPPLLGSPWVVGDPDRLIRIILHGVRGPITVNDKTINMEMPALGVMEDEQIAAILTYARREWGHTADPVATKKVTAVREETKDRQNQWTESELLKVK